MVDKKLGKNYSDTITISFRAPRTLVKELDKIASSSQRSRANFIVRTLTQAVSLEPAVATIEQILPRLAELDQRAPDSVQAEYYRGLMSGARSVIGAFFGKRAVRWVNQTVRERTRLPMPHVVPLAEDGNRYGFDSEADI